MIPLVSIIIATKKNNRFLEECLKRCLKLDYQLFEIVVLPDEMFGVYNDSRIKIIPTGTVLPAIKRDIGADNASGQILAFLDDDAYPCTDWLKQAVLNFKDESIACVCGPAVTPKEEATLNKGSGRVYESIIISGPARYRYVPLKSRFCDDFPSCNFLIRKDIFQKAGGFNTKFWPGEDTILCLEVVHRLKKRILYDPAVIVYHHRRPLFKEHLRQVAGYALHRGYFLKRYPQTSFKLGYFLPSFIMFLLLLSLFFGLFLDYRYIFIIASYLLFVFIFSFQGGARLSFYVFMGIILTHLIYGFNFIKGLLSNKLEEE